MKSTNKLHRNRVDWATIKEEDFNRLVEGLLVKLHRDGPGRVLAINGRGGDQGIDVAVWVGDAVKVVYQLKYYPQGFTGDRKSSRRRKIKESFETAWKKHTPPEWILVMPPNPHMEEKKFVDGLPAGRPVTVDIWGQATLDSLLADYPSLERAALRGDLEDVLIQMNQEKAALLGPNDLGDRVAGLGELADARSQYWDTGFSYVNGEVDEYYTPKHPDAMLVDPIKTSLTINLGPQHADLAEMVRDGYEYGTFEPIPLAPGIAKLTREGPAWVKPIRSDPTAQFSLGHLTRQPTKKELLTLNFVDDEGFSCGRFEGVIVSRTSGTKGAQVKAKVANIVTLITRVAHDPAEEEGGLTIKFGLIGAPVSDALTAWNLRQALQPGRLMEIYYQGQLVSKNRLGADFADAASDPYTLELLEDLCYLQQKLPAATFVLPEDTYIRDRAMLRVARILLDRELTVMPPGTELTATLSGQRSDKLLDFVRNGGLFLSQPKTFRLEIQGSTYNLGPASLFHRNLRVVDWEKVLAALDAGTAESLPIRMVPNDDEPVQVWLGHVKDASAPLPSYKAWDLTGIGFASSANDETEAADS